MQTNFYSQGSYNNFDFSFKTSSGDQINFSMYDNKSLEYSSQSSHNQSSRSLTLTHEYGYNFSYVGDGLDEQDLAELNEALKQIAPQVDEFMKNVKDADKIAGTNQSITELANSIKSKLPQAKNNNHQNMINDNVLKLFDKLLETNKANNDLLDASKRLFDRLIDQTNKLYFYA
ncbi:ATP/GTP-binding protein [Campylobacter sp. RM13119]|uniref:ATP/GTP-binding protein n=1 Tax=Campylobacter californiensis TaxID=1032243 RepID=UPI0014762E15|nr:ATP/GTP-binding protein [Campylobacter sp. RM13119]MBE3606392.1 ATP/GTP-binding protein [Campylobacter sp. RM13119]